MLQILNLIKNDMKLSSLAARKSNATFFLPFDHAETFLFVCSTKKFHPEFGHT